MWKATIKGIVAHRVRLVLSMVAVVLGVAFVAGTYVLTDTLSRSYTGLFDDTVSGVDLVVQLAGQRGPAGTRERFDERALAQVRGVRGVGEADGVVSGYAEFVDRNGDAVRHAGGLTLGVSWFQHGGDGPLRLVGRSSGPPRGPREVAMDVATARANGFRVGDRVRVLLQGPAQEFTISGLFRVGTRSDLGGVTVAAFDLPTAQEAVGAPGQLDTVNVVGTPGTDLDALRTRLERALGPAYEVVAPHRAARDTGYQVRNLLELLTRLLLGFALIGVVIAALLVFNTFTIVVAQRARELGLMRVIGASRRQVVGALVGEALVVGAVASAIGLGLGIVVASLLLRLVEQFGFDVPSGGIAVLPRTIVVALGVGIAVTVAAALWPALRASRDAPLAAYTDTVPSRGRPRRRRAVVGAVLLVAGVPALVLGVDRTRDQRHLTGDLGWVAAGAVLVLLGVIVLLATFAGPLASSLGRVGERRGVSGHLARENAVRNPRRTAATASALVIGLALVSLVAIFGASTKASVRTAVDRGIRADAVLKAQQFAGFSPAVAERVAEMPRVRAVSPFQFRKVRVNGNVETVVSAEHDGLARTTDLNVVAGSLADLEPDGVLVHEDAARDYGVGVGDTLNVQMARGVYPLRVAAIYRQADFTGGFPISFVVPRAVYELGFGNDEQDQLVYVAGKGDPDALVASIRRGLHRDFPNVDVFSLNGYRDDQQRAIDRFLAVTAALLLLSEVIAVLGIVNTLALSVFERTRELGLLRAVGMSRVQVREMIRGESLIIAAIGAVLGIAVGLVWGWVFVAAVHGQGITQLSIPVLALLVFLVVALLAGVVAAWLPARRAARLDVLSAIATE